MSFVRTYKFRVKDSGSAGRLLSRLARAVNGVWNFVKETQITALRRSSARMITDKKTGLEVAIPNFLSAYELNNLVAGCSKLLGIHSQTAQAVAEEYSTRRKQFKKLLRWRGRKSLGWIPFKSSGIRVDFDGAVLSSSLKTQKIKVAGTGVATYCGHKIDFWCSRTLPDDAKIVSGSFSQDARGRWYFNLTFKTEEHPLACGDGAVGVDIGVKTMATTSDGEKIDGPRLRERYLKKVRKIEKTRTFARRKQSKTRQFGKLPKAKQLAAIAAKAKNARSDHLHKESTKLVRKYREIHVGNVPLALMNRSSMAGVSLDHGTGMFKQMLRYKADGAGGAYNETNERDSTRTCSVCRKAHPRIGLGVREWHCDGCETVHDRDVNAARNILRVGHDALTRTDCSDTGSV